MFIGTIINNFGCTILYFSSISLAHVFNLAFGHTTQCYHVPHPSKTTSYYYNSFIPILVDLCFHLSRLSSCLVNFPICIVDVKFFLVDLASILVDLSPRRLSGLLIS